MISKKDNQIVKKDDGGKKKWKERETSKVGGEKVPMARLCK